jgi:MarR family transcriptional regulator for hemolysin
MRVGRIAKQRIASHPIADSGRSCAAHALLWILIHGGVFILRAAHAENMLNQQIAKHAQVGLLLAAVRRRQRQAVESRVARLGLSSQQFWVLEAIARQGKCSFGEIMAGLPLDQPTASRVLAELRNRDLIEISMDADDRRRRRLGLTTDGTRLAQQCGTIAKQIRKALSAGFSGSELATLATLLGRILYNFDDLDVTSPPGQDLPTGKQPARAPASLFRQAGAFTNPFVRSSRRNYW